MQTGTLNVAKNKPKKKNQSHVGPPKPRTLTGYISKAALNGMKQPSSSRAKIFLESRRGVRVQGGGRCNEFGMSEKLVWRYAKSSKGTVQICSRCKAKVFDRSFGTVDAFNNAYEGGAFESNPHRH